MLSLPSRFAAVILCFAPLFRERSWRHAEVLLIGAILAPGRRTVACTAPGSLDKWLAYAARLKASWFHAARAAWGLR